MQALDSHGRLSTGTLSPTARSQGVLARHPLTFFFVLAFALAWLCEIPAALSKAGLGLLPFRPSLDQLDMIVILASFAGPTLAALTLTGALEGRAGVVRLLKRYVQWRAGIQWYLLALFGMPLIAVLAASAFLGAAPLTGLLHQWPLLLTLYVPYTLTIGLILGGPLAEEPGWRGFALPHLQRRYGAVGASLILGVLWGLWHLPLFMIPALDGSHDVGANVMALVGFMVAIVAFTIIMTWVYNNTAGSLLIVMVLHSARNGVVLLERQIFPAFLHSPERYWALALGFAICALLLIIFTRAALSKEPAASKLNGVH
jgi:membrane protease YdiL (CAAX protease family)